MMGCVRHLSEQQALAALRRGETVEQMLTAVLDETRVVSWLVVQPAAERAFAVRLHRVTDEDVVEPDFLDLYEFTPLDDNEPIGEGHLVGEFPEAEHALSAAASLGARGDRWVNGGLVQDEYFDLQDVRRRRTATVLTDRASLVELVAQLMGGDFETEGDVNRAAASFEASVPRPGASDLIFYWQDEFDHEPTPEEVVDRALAYRGFAL